MGDLIFGTIWRIAGLIVGEVFGACFTGDNVSNCNKIHKVTSRQHFKEVIEAIDRSTWLILPPVTRPICLACCRLMYLGVFWTLAEFPSDKRLWNNQQFDFQSKFEWHMRNESKPCAIPVLFEGDTFAVCLICRTFPGEQTTCPGAGFITTIWRREISAVKMNEDKAELTFDTSKERRTHRWARDSSTMWFFLCWPV